MDNYQDNLREETAYLEETLEFIRRELDYETKNLSARKNNLIASRKDMWENTVHFTEDFARLTEINQHLSEVNNLTVMYTHNLKRIKNYEVMIASPYFGRFDFKEDDSQKIEKVYIGYHNVGDYQTNDIYIYDWRAPISSIFYRHELGKAAYNAPAGTITGDVTLKRQYKIEDAKLKYFFDCSIRINDEILREILSRNASPRMRNIVETIQKEQDFIIRDTEHELVIVQGVAGSGKTSIAMHRVAFLLYDSLSSNLDANKVLIVSPNTIFSRYISSVLPELGEVNVRQNTFDDIVFTALNGRFIIETRDKQLEALIADQDKSKGDLKRQSIAFKGSKAFLQILEKFLWHYAHRLIPFEDVYFNGAILETKEQLKNRFLNNKTGIPMARQLQRIESMIWERVHPLQKKRLEKIQHIVADSAGHELEVKSFSRLLSMKRTKLFITRLHRFTRIDYWHLYKMLFNQRDLFDKVAQGIELPAEIEEIIAATRENLQKDEVDYEDCAPLLYLLLRVEGNPHYPEIEHVVIDEAQDYYPVQYEVFKLLFKKARFTVLGDISQAFERDVDNSLYDDISKILEKQKILKLFLKIGYRSSYEINLFTQRLLGKQQGLIPFRRHETEPLVEQKENQEAIDRAIIRDIAYCLEQGYESIAVICKTQEQSQELYSRLNKLTKIKLIKPSNGEVEKGVMVIAAYLAKGLEFDVVIVYGVDKETYATDLDRKLLYVACTRALHRLVVYYTGEKPPFLSAK